MVTKPIWPNGRFGVPQITPYTYRDGQSLLELIKALRDHVVEQLHPSLQHAIDQLVADVESEYEKAHDRYVDGVQEFQRIHDAFMSDVNSSLKALNDGAATDLINDAGSLLGSSLRTLLGELVTQDDSALFGALSDRFAQITDTMEIYVATNGDDTHPGTQNQPFRTVNAAITKALQQSAKPGHSVIINIAAGTYEDRVILPDYTPTRFKLELRGQDIGGHPNTPVTVFSEGLGTTAIQFINRNPNADVEFHNIKWFGYNGSSSSSATSFTGGFSKYLNCHVDSCHYGFSSFNGSLVVPNGVMENCGIIHGQDRGSGAAIRSMMGNRHTIGIQNAGNRSNTLHIKNCVRGVYIQETSTGHVDYATIEGCERGVHADVNSRANVTGTLFEDCTIGVYSAGGSHVFVPNQTMFQNVRTKVYTVIGGLYLSTQDSPNMGVAGARSEQHTYAEYDEFTATTTNRSFFSRSVYADWYNDDFRISSSPYKKITTRSLVELESGGAKSITVRHAGVAISMEYGNTESGIAVVESEIIFAGKNRQIIVIRSTNHLGSPRILTRTYNLKLTGEVDVNLQARSDDGAGLSVLFTESSIVQ